MNHTQKLPVWDSFPLYNWALGFHISIYSDPLDGWLSPTVRTFDWPVLFLSPSVEYFVLFSHNFLYFCPIVGGMSPPLRERNVLGRHGTIGRSAVSESLLSLGSDAFRSHSDENSDQREGERAPLWFFPLFQSATERGKDSSRDGGLAAHRRSGEVA